MIKTQVGEFEFRPSMAIPPRFSKAIEKKIESFIHDLPRNYIVEKYHRRTGGAGLIYKFFKVEE